MFRMFRRGECSSSTKPALTLHLLVTSLCDRDCKYCCNKQYDIQNLPYVTDEEFKQADMVCLTGGEPFKYTNPPHILSKIRIKYPNIEHAVVYSNAWELYGYLINEEHTLTFMDGVNVSIKNKDDLWVWEHALKTDERLTRLSMNRVYDFTGKVEPCEHFEYIRREWQENFVPAENCLFRRYN